MVIMEDVAASLYDSIEFSSDDLYVAAGGIDGAIVVWNAHSGSCELKCVVADGTSRTSTITKYSGGQPSAEMTGPVPLRSVKAIAWRPKVEQGQPHVFVCASDSGKVVWWNVETGEWRYVDDGMNGNQWAVRDIRYSPDGTVIGAIFMNAYLRLWDSTTLQLVRALKGRDNGPLRALAFAPDGARVAVANFDFSIQIWDTASGDETAYLRGHSEAIWSLEFEPRNGGRRLITGSEDGTAQIWNTETGQSLVVLDQTGRPIWRVAFTPDGARVCVGLLDGSALIFDSYDGSKVSTIISAKSSEWPMSATPHAVLSPAGDRIIIASGTRIKLCDVNTGEAVSMMVEHSDIVTKMQFSHDGERIIASAEDGQVRAWALSELDPTLRDEAVAMELLVADDPEDA